MSLLQNENNLQKSSVKSSKQCRIMFILQEALIFIFLNSKLPNIFFRFLSIILLTFFLGCTSQQSRSDKSRHERRSPKRGGYEAK